MAFHLSRLLLTNLNHAKGLQRYILAALLTRIATGGSAVATVMLARHVGTDALYSGLFAACLTAPHVLGPVYGRVLDTCRDPRIVLAIAFVVFSGAFQLALRGYQCNSNAMIVASLLLCGVCSSFMMGGLSTQLVKLVENTVHARRRGQTWDNLTYGIGLTIGPLLIALLSSAFSIDLAASTLMCMPLLAGAVVITLPPLQTQRTNSGPESGFGQIMTQLIHSPPLVRTLIMTSVASFGMAMLPVLAVYLAVFWGQNQQAGAYLVMCYGVGNILGATLLIFVPLKADALILLCKLGTLLLVAVLLLALSSNYYAGLAGYGLCGISNATFFAATLAARSEYAPVNGAAQIYMWVAAAKITAGSLGALLCGLLLQFGIAVPLYVSCSVLAICLFVCFKDGLPLPRQ